MKRLILILTGMTILAAGIARAAFPTSTSSATVRTDKITGNWDSFSFKWIDANDQQCYFTLTNASGFVNLTGFYPRARISKDGTCYVDVGTAAISITATGVSFSVAYTNVPPPSSYDFELWAWSTATSNQRATLGQGRLNVAKSLYSDTNQFPFPSSGSLSLYATLVDLGNATNALIALINSSTSAVTTAYVNTAVGNASNSLVGIINAGNATVSNAQDSARVTLSNAVDATYAKIGMVTATSNAISGAVSALSNSVSGILTTLSNNVDATYATKGMVQTASNSIPTAIGNLSNSVMGSLSTLSNNVDTTYATKAGVSAVSNQLPGMIATGAMYQAATGNLAYLSAPNTFLGANTFTLPLYFGGSTTSTWSKLFGADLFTPETVFIIRDSSAQIALASTRWLYDSNANAIAYWGDVFRVGPNDGTNLAVYSVLTNSPRLDAKNIFTGQTNIFAEIVASMIRASGGGTCYIDPVNGRLYDPDGEIMLDWMNAKLNDTTGAASIDASKRTLTGTNGNVLLAWSNTVVRFPTTPLINGTNVATMTDLAIASNRAERAFDYANITNKVDYWDFSGIFTTATYRASFGGYDEDRYILKWTSWCDGGTGQITILQKAATEGWFAGGSTMAVIPFSATKATNATWYQTKLTNGYYWQPRCDGGTMTNFHFSGKHLR